MGQTALTSEEVRKMQLKGLEMALFFDEFCKKHGLLYYFCGGCCIGALRHQGFVPWDDDVDVFMPRADYEKLKQLWVDTPEYSIQYPTRKVVTENQFATICANNTTFIKTYQMNLDINHGLVLDILPLDGCPTGWRRKLQKFWALLYSLFVVGKAPENHSKLLYILGKIALGIVRPKAWRYAVWRFCEKQMSKYPIEKCDYVTELCAGPHYMQNEYRREWFDSAVRKEFEGHQMPLPVGYDSYLRMAFGDYMQLPPEDKRVCHHAFEVMDMDNSYLLYRGKRYFTGKTK